MNIFVSVFFTVLFYLTLRNSHAIEIVLFLSLVRFLLDILIYYYFNNTYQILWKGIKKEHRMNFKSLKLTMAILFTGLMSIGSANASIMTFEMSIVADNDFAVFSGDSAGINNLLYQNNVGWGAQIGNLSSLSFSLAAGDNKFYVLGMGGGGTQENISGLVNGVNMTSLSVLMSSNLTSYLSGYDALAVEAGTYNASLVDVQNAFSQVSWSDASLNLNTTQTVIQQAGFGSGFKFSTVNAHLFSFDAVDVDVEVSAVPEPSTLAIFALGMIGLASRRFKKQS